MMNQFARAALILAFASFFALTVFSPNARAAEPAPDFGDDSGDYVNDGECDDPRFVGEGATTAGAARTDASDCRKLWEAGAIMLRSSLNPGIPEPDFGDDSGPYVNDGDCDDVRFEGENATTAGRPGTDASDCRTLWTDGLITLRARINDGVPEPDFGDDSGEYTDDGDCDDPRFEGAGSTMLGAPGTDASDCRTLWNLGLITVRARLNEGLDAPDFGEDSGEWINDGECDDPRFSGPGASNVGTASTDASDCAKAWEAGTITLRSEADLEVDANSIMYDDIIFGDNSSSWANDRECDDPRFAGEGMASILNIGDLGRDATDCLVLYVRGEIRLKE